METGVGKRIKKRRTSLFLTQEELAHRMGYKSKAAICKVEGGEDNITSDRINKFAEALETTPAYLMGWTNQMGIDPVSGYPVYDEEELLDVSERSDFLNSFTHEEENILRKIRELEKYYSIPEIERALDFIALYQKAIPEIQAAVESLLKSQKHDP